ncbi:hypothetical protein [Phycisphaera mikurensis]|uniref:Uncharacterized protein n=1 Tax=Phycisphaera mikurensis (strain NBRC 102666 / KCTC 22515 / FYK2301M01) TaxID=1142394 RepID=I0IAB7_PHYMF|nr:hypothetical protein [Phycisphaera mikurensis]MBB6441796.1 hypothetical protein [Phycisphaera mikurensis]BAM02205.1 hypothetical protein PSMK_00460 [Phycisphaera mikurensis NBRC 102666]
MDTAASRPRLLLAASLLCAFSLVGVIGYHARPAGAHAARTVLPAATAAELRRPVREVRGTPDAPGGDAYTLAPDGTGLVPTRAPGGFVDAEAVAEPGGPAASAAADAAGLGFDPKPLEFTMPGSRRPASAAKRAGGG